MRRVLGLAATVAALMGNAAAAQTSVTAAWEGALSAIEGSEHWVPGSTRISVETLNGRGEVEQTMTLAQTTELTEQGLEVAVELDSAPSGGVGGGMMRGLARPDPGDPAQMSNMDATSGPGTGLGGMQAGMAGPFAAAVRGEVALHGTGATRTIGGVMTEEFRIEWTDGDGSVFGGRIWLDASSHAPVRLDATGDLADRNIREFHFTVTYGTFGALTLPARAVRTQTVRTGLFSSRTTRATATFADYFETDGTQEYIYRGVPGQEDSDGNSDTE
jgi:hypothetical protein